MFLINTGSSGSSKFLHLLKGIDQEFIAGIKFLMNAEWDACFKLTSNDMMSIIIGITLHEG